MAYALSPESPATVEGAIQDIDQLLAAVGLSHGSRKLMAAGFERQTKHPRKLPAAQRRTELRSKNRMEIVRPPLFAEIDWLISGFSTRTGGKTSAYNPGQQAGELNLGFTPADSRQNVLENRRRFLKEATSNPAFPTITLRQIHSSLIRRVTAKDADVEARWKADGMMTTNPACCWPFRPPTVSPSSLPTAKSEP